MSSITASAMRKKRRTIAGFRGHAAGGDSFDGTSINGNNDFSSSNFSLGMVPEDQLSCLEGMVGTGSEHIVVAVRVRPLSTAELAEGKRSCCDVLNGNTVVIKKSADPAAYLRSQKGSMNEYTFDAAFPPEAGQSEVYDGTARPYISELLEGINVTVFAYGATGAGKTHTMMGSERVVGTRVAEDGSEEVSGIVPQSLVELFRLIAERMEDQAGCGKEQEMGDGEEVWTVRVGYLQVYNEQIYDLLTPSSKPLRINEDPSKGVVVVAGLAEMEVNSSDEVLNLLRQGNANRRTEATGANQVSSRSHAVLQVAVTRKIMVGQRTDSSRESKLSLIDLAGSERASATNNRGEQLRQGANINKSLLSLANCINALAANRRRRGGKGASNVKYRDSKLTHLLKASLEGRCRLVMIANVNPSHVYFDDSHNTLKYANRAKNIKVDPKMAEALRGGGAAGADRDQSRLAKDYEALKERNALVEAQLEALRNARGFIEPEPAGFTDLFAPNTSSIMSVASSTPGRSDRCITTNNNYTSSKPLIQQQQQQQQEEVEGSSSSSNVIAGRGGGGGIAGGITKIRRSLERSGAGGGGGYGHGHNDDTDAGVASGREARGVGHGGHEDNSAVRMPPLAPRGGGGGGGRAGRAGLRSDWSEQETGEKRHDGNYDDGDGYDAEEEARAEEGIDGEDEAMVVAYAESPVIVRRRVGRVGLGGEEGVGSAAAAASLAPLTASATKRKRRPDADGNGNNGDPYDHVRRGARGNVNVPAWESERELAAERTRVCELEGKVRELEGLMARMGQQHDVTMELVETWRNNKEAAELAAEEERANVNELLFMLKDKERESTQLRVDLAEATARVALTGSGGPGEGRWALENGAAGGGGGTGEVGMRANTTNSAASRCGLMLMDDNSTLVIHNNNNINRNNAVGNSSSSSCALGQIEEHFTIARDGQDMEDDANNGGGAHDDLCRQAVEEGYSAVTDIVARKRRISSVGAGAVGSTSETTAHRKASDSPCLLALPSQNSDSSAMEAASAIKAQRRTSSMIPRSRKSMLPAPRSSGTKPTSSRRGLADMNVRFGMNMSTELNGTTGATPSKKAKSKTAQQQGLGGSNSGSSSSNNNNSMAAVSASLYQDENDIENMNMKSSSSNGVAPLRRLSSSAVLGGAGGVSGAGPSSRANSRRSLQIPRAAIATRTRSRLSVPSPITSAAAITAASTRGFR